MPVELPKGLPFSVDTWSPSSNSKRHHFLTHAHRDHSVGISSHSSYPIYSTQFTKTLLLHQFPQLDESLFVAIEVGQTVVIDDLDGDFRVSAFDANHCPGAVMFLFEGTFGNILHTGDCRLTPECLLSLPEKYIGKKGKQPRYRLDFVFLDCTFGNVSLDMPSKHFAIRQVINCIWKHPEAPVVYLTCNLLGQEEVLVNVSQTFGSKIYMDKTSNPGFFCALELTVPEILSQDPSCRFQLFDAFPNLNERAHAKVQEARNNFQPEPLIIRPSTQWYAHNEIFSSSGSKKVPRINEAVKDQFGIWHVCYSMHSSREELEWALQLLAPKWVVSTTPGCRAMELGFVKKHCSSAHIALDDPLWKLLDINLEASLETDESVKEVCCSEVESSTQTCTEHRLKQVKISVSQETKISSSLKRAPVTLFGRARLGLPVQGSTVQSEGKTIVSTSDVLQSISTSKKSQEREVFSGSEDFPSVRYGKPLERKVEGNVTVEKCENPDIKEDEQRKSVHSPIGTSEGFSETMRKMYRSMNVPVPRPLPSLVELLKTTKRSRRRFEL